MFCSPVSVIVPHNMEVVTASCIRRKLNIALDLVKDKIIRLPVSTHRTQCLQYVKIISSHVELDGRLTQNLMRHVKCILAVGDNFSASCICNDQSDGKKFCTVIGLEARYSTTTAPPEMQFAWR